MNNALTDGQGRRIEYLRISVTDRCDLRCAYCMPPGGAELQPRCEILQYKELLKLIKLFAKLGVQKVRLTGGEPLIRKGIIGFIKQVGEIEGIERMTLTTNGTRLKDMAVRLKESGIFGLNVSLDTLREERYKSITGKGSLPLVLSGIESAIDAGLPFVKVNMVVMKGVNDDEIGDFIDLARKKSIQVRFLEFMPATPTVWSENRFVPMTEVKKRIIAIAGDIIPLEKAELSGPAEVYRFNDGKGEIGFIAAVTHHFCSQCNRLRLTSSGELISCLFGAERLNLKAMLRANATDAQLAEAIANEVKKKNNVRTLPFDLTDKHAREMKMSGIGG